MAKRQPKRGKRPVKTQRVGSSRRSGKPGRELEKCFYFGVLSFAVVLTAMLARGAVFYPLRSTFSQEPIAPVGVSQGAIYRRAMVLGAKYDSRPYWTAPKLVPGRPVSQATADLAIEHLIPCESMGRPVNHLDTNWKMSYGILQFQDWQEWERVSGMRGDPDNPDDAIRMAEWGIESGMIDHWGCASILHMT
jgi:hypothetical protein